MCYNAPCMPDSINERLREGISKKDAGIAQDALDAGADPNAPLYAGASPLHLAAMLGSAPVVRCLIEAGADVHAVDGRGKQTPLHYAALSTAPDALDTIDALLNGGASVNADLGDGTPLDIALIARVDEHARALHAAGGRCTTHETRQKLRKLLRSISDPGKGPGSTPG